MWSEVKPGWVLGLGLLMLIPVWLCAQSIPNEAIVEAEKVLGNWKQKAVSDPNWFEDRFKISSGLEDYSNAVLENPYVLYTMDTEQLLKYEQSDDIEILSNARIVNYGFPITVDGNFVGALVVCRNRNKDGDKIVKEKGEYVCYGTHASDNAVDKELLDLRNEFPSDSGYSIVKLKVSDIGGFLLVRKDGATRFLSPTDYRSASRLFLEPPMTKGQFPVIPLEEAAPMIRDVAKERRAILETRSPQNTPR